LGVTTIPLITKIIIFVDENRHMKLDIATIIKEYNALHLQDIIDYEKYGEQLQAEAALYRQSMEQQLPKPNVKNNF